MAVFGGAITYIVDRPVLEFGRVWERRMMPVLNGGAGVCAKGGILKTV